MLPRQSGSDRGWTGRTMLMLLIGLAQPPPNSPSHSAHDQRPVVVSDMASHPA